MPNSPAADRSFPERLRSTEECPILRRRHEAFIHPLAEVRAEPFARQFPAQSFLLALSVNQCAGGGKLDADAGVALVVNDLLLAFPSWMRADQNLAQLADLVPTELSLIDEIEKLALLVCDRRLFVIKDDEVAADHRRRIRLRATVNAVGVDDSGDDLPGLQPVAIEYGLTGIGRAHDNV